MMCTVQKKLFFVFLMARNPDTAGSHQITGPIICLLIAAFLVARFINQPQESTEPFIFSADRDAGNNSY